MLGLHGGSVVSADTLVALLWGDEPPRTATKALQTHVSSLRRALGDGFVLTEGTGWTLSTTEIDAVGYKTAAKLGRKALAAGDPTRAVSLFDQALALWRGIPELPDSSRGSSEKTRWLEGHAALVEDRADALLATGRAAEIVGELESAIAEAPLRERRWGHLMLALYRAGRQGEALGAYRRARSLLAEELGVDPGPELRRLEAAIVAQDAALEMPQSQQLSTVTRAVTFLLTDIEGSTAAWEADADAMGRALARHDEIVEQVVTSRGGRLIKTRGEGDATFSVFDRPSAAAAAAIELQGAIGHEDWRLAHPMRIRVALHTGEVEFRDGDYFGRAVNRAARLRSLATGGQILCSGATAELVIDSLPDDVVLADLGTRRLRNLPRPEHVFELRMETADDPAPPTTEAPMVRPALPGVLVGPGPFVGRGHELERLVSAWQSTLAAGTRAVLIAGEPGVGKTRLAGEWSRHAYEQGAVVLYGRCDEDLGAPYQPFAEALRSLVSCVDSNRLRSVRGVESLLPLVPGLGDALPDVTVPPRADPDTERYAMFDAVVALLGTASATAPVVLILDDLHWAAKPTLLLLRHLLRFGDEARVQIIGTYRSTDLDRSHPLAAMLADLHRDGTATRLQLSGLEEGDVTAYVAEVGYHDEELGRALATVTGGNPFFLIEALRHVEESGGRWDPSTLPQGVREAVSRRLSRLTAETNKALAAAAVVGSRFALTLVEQVVGEDLVDAFDEAAKSGIVIEEPGGRYRFNHALVRQSLLAELPSVRRMRLHQRIAGTLEGEAGADDELLAELAYHYFECAWAGNAVKAVEYCRRAADQAMSRVAYEGAADLYDRALHALEELDDELPDRDALQAELLIAHCEALLAAGDVTSAKDAVTQLRATAGDSGRLGAWGICFDGELSMLTDPERLDDIESAVNVAAERLAALDDAAGEAKAHTVRAGCLARLGRIGDCETALDQALTAARRARDHSRVNAVLAGAPLAALWGPNPVPRAGGRCLDVVRLLRITTGSPLVEATSTRCQAVLDALRGRAAEGRRLIESARRTLTELGLRHALLEVDQFAGIIELVADDAAAAEPYLRRAYEGFHRMGLDIDTADTAALLARACLALDRADEADELCSVSERLAGHGSKASIAWRSVRAHLLARAGAHGRAREVAEEAVSLAGATDALVDHGDACLALATVLHIAGDAAGMRVAAEQAVTLYDRKGAAALTEKARKLLGTFAAPEPSAAKQPVVELSNACVEVGQRVINAINRQAWDEFERLFAAEDVVESRRRIIGFTQADLQQGNWVHQNRTIFETSGNVRISQSVVAVRGDHLALSRLFVGSTDMSPGAPQDEFLQIYGIDDDGHISLQVWFDADDLGAAHAELDALHARLNERRQQGPLENAATRADDRANGLYVENRMDEIGALLVENYLTEDRRQGLRRVSNDRATALENIRAIASVGPRITITPIALRGDRLCLSHTLFENRRTTSDGFTAETLDVVEIDDDGRMTARIVFDLEAFDAAIAELDARYSAGEAEPFAQTWSTVTQLTAAFNRPEYEGVDCPSVDHRRLTRYAPDDLTPAVITQRDFTPDLRTYIEVVNRISERGVVVTTRSRGVTKGGFEAEWRVVNILLIDGDQIERYELFDETDVDTALARFDELSRPVHRLENTATRVSDRLYLCFRARDWAALADLVGDGFEGYDRRQVVNVDLHGSDAVVESFRAVTNFGDPDATTAVLATRGSRLALTSVRYAVSADGVSDAFQVDLLQLVEIDSDERIASLVTFDLDDAGGAHEELDTRYMSGEGSAYAQTWTVIARGYAALNRNELAPTTSDWVNVDHRRLAPVTAGRLGAYIRTSQAETPDLDIRVAAVHRISELGAVVTRAVTGTSREGFYAEWREIDLVMVEGELVSRCEIFDEVDLDAALTEFDELSRREPRVVNAASRVADRFRALFAERNWDALGEVFTEDIIMDDRRHTVSAAVITGKNAQIANLQALAQIGVTIRSSDVIATRGERLVLKQTRYSGERGFHADTIEIIEVDANNRFASYAAFDPDSLEAAFAELETRYIAGEAASHAQTWTVVVDVFASLARHEIPPSTADWSNVDHRRGTPLATSDLREVTAALWELTPDLHNYIETVHRLGDKVALVTQVSRGTTAEGFPAEWRMLNLMTTDGPLVSGCELFDETDLEAATARFKELSRPESRCENAASRAGVRFRTHLAAKDWETIASLFTDDYYYDDRRRIVNSGVRHGRAHAIEDIRSAVDIGLWGNLSSEVVAVRGERLALTRFRAAGRDPGASQLDVIQAIEINADGLFSAVVVWDIVDIDAAFEELETRYLAGEAAAHAHAWSVIAGAYAAVLRHELPQTTPDWINVDHRRVTSFAPNELEPFLKATWDVLDPDISIYIEAVHRLTDIGALVTRVIQGTSREGFTAEWREIGLTTVRGDRINRSELFDEDDFDNALARFDELNRSPQRPENSASRTADRFCECFGARDWAGMADTLAGNVRTDDRRPVVGVGERRGPKLNVADWQAVADVGTRTLTSTVLATRGHRLALSRFRTSGRDQRPEAFHTEILAVIETNVDDRIVACVMFDRDGMDAAFAELDARYGAGDGAAHLHTWTALSNAIAAFNRRELPATTPDWINIDHRKVTTFTPGQLFPYVHTSWELAPNISNYIEAVHRLSDLGAVVTRVATGTSPQGFSAEWRVITLAMFDGGLLSRVELFDETDADAALAKFEELNRPAPQLENSATRMYDRLLEHHAAHDYDASAKMLAERYWVDDRRRVVNAGIRHGRDAAMADARTVTELGGTHITSDVIATRGDRLFLTRSRVFIRDEGPEAFDNQSVVIVEIGADERATSMVVFDLDDTDAAFAELDARYLAGEAAPYAEVWSGIAEAYAMFNRHEVPRILSWETVDHRVRETFAAEDLAAYIRSAWDVTPDNKMYIECVHRLNDRGAVLTHTAYGRSPEGFHAEWRMIALLTIDRTATNRCDLFEEADLDIAISKFDELSARPRQPENAATRALTRALACFEARDWETLQQVMAEDFTSYDHRRVVNAGVRRGRAIHVENMQSVADVGLKYMGSPVIATRGERLALCRSRFAARALPSDEVAAEALLIVETDAANRLVANTVFDLEDFTLAFADLDARYAVGEALVHAQTWSVVTQAYTALNRHEHFDRDWTFFDHRRGTPFASDVSAASKHPAVWDVTPDLSAHIEVVHRLSDAAVLITAVTRGTSPEGFDAEWRFVQLLTVKGDSIERCELFDEADLDAALARFDELNRPRPRIENTVTRKWASVVDAFNRRDLDAYLELVTADRQVDDRRKGLQALISGPDQRAHAGLMFELAPHGWQMEADPIAVRGARLSLIRTFWVDENIPERPVTNELVGVVELGSNGLINRVVAFDPDDIASALEDLDMRYLAGEAASFAHTWSLVIRTYDAFNRHELSATTDDWVNIDHRQVIASAPGDVHAYVRESWKLASDISTRIEAVHRLSETGAVFTHTESGTSRKGFLAEWREVTLLTFDGEAINRCEIFDEADLDTAVARFDELSRPAPRLENAATEAWTRAAEAFNNRNQSAFLALVAPAGRVDDRRKGLNAIHSGVERTKAAQAVFEVPESWRTDIEAVAIRGSHLSLIHQTYRDIADIERPITVELLSVLEVDDDDLVVDIVNFDSDDIDAAFDELEARYLAGEAAPHARTWSAVADGYAAFNRRELFKTTPDWVNIDHRRGGASFAPGEQIPLVSATWDVVPKIRAYAEVVHRLDTLGAVVTQVVKATSQEGFDGEWRELILLTVDGHALSRCEVFDEVDLDAALARFDDLNRPAHRLENTAALVRTQLLDAFNNRDLDVFRSLITPDGRYDDRRKGLRSEGLLRHEFVPSMISEAPDSWRWTDEPVAIRGHRLVLCRDWFRDTDAPGQPTTVEDLSITEVMEAGLVCHCVIFDSDHLDAAMRELDARWIASGEVKYPGVIEALLGLLEAANRRDWDAVLAAHAADALFVNHRQLATGRDTIADYWTSIRAFADLVPDMRFDLADVLSHSATGIVCDVVVRGTSPDGVAVEVELVTVLLVETGQVTHIENFEPDDRDWAVARFEELNASS
ncbi:BTAD domain-containing putative transcriptional regulator [Mycobacterium sp. 852002-51152_SCH6134967]|uniref:nuclear transport factor 2 family protein n=1 Tax=Mycobacterium sp. 852002-51152_SCH6134967 TaxID=1834096 RepID=UPI001E4E88EB|nr:BTAD domain-containing putative transcriptional regulator [Mycobacterium sp. 852002-51152_SCH6134967]